MHVILQTCELIFIVRYGICCLINGGYRFISMLYSLGNDIQRQLTCMRLLFPFLFYIFYQFLTFRSATFIEPRIDGIFVWIDKLTHKHTQQQCLAISFCDAETTQQLRCYFATFFIRLTNQSGILIRCTIELT